MSDDSVGKKIPKGIDRRKFLQVMGATGAALAVCDIVSSKAQAVEMKRMDMGGDDHILGCNEMTSTHGYWKNSTKSVLTINRAKPFIWKQGPT